MLEVLRLLNSDLASGNTGFQATTIIAPDNIHDNILLPSVGGPRNILAESTLNDFILRNRNINQGPRGIPLPSMVEYISIPISLFDDRSNQPLDRGLALSTKLSPH